jgi:hypothetical protein
MWHQQKRGVFGDIKCGVSFQLLFLICFSRYFLAGGVRAFLHETQS